MNLGRPAPRDGTLAMSSFRGRAGFTARNPESTFALHWKARWIDSRRHGARPAGAFGVRVCNPANAVRFRQQPSRAARKWRAGGWASGAIRL